MRTVKLCTNEILQFLTAGACRQMQVDLYNGRKSVMVVVTGVNATGDAGDTSPAIFGQPGMKCLISPAKFVKFLLLHSKRRGS